MSNNKEQGVATGGKTPVDPESKKIQEIAAYAVQEYNKEQHKELKLVRVRKAMQQVVSGMMYFITLEAEEGMNISPYYAQVWEKEWIQWRKLVAFNHLVENEKMAIPN